MDQATLQFSLEPADNAKLANLCGSYDGNIKAIERRLEVAVRRRGSRFEVTGAGDRPYLARDVFQQLYSAADGGVDESSINKVLASYAQELPAAAGGAYGIEALNPNQHRYLAAIRANNLTFGVGASGTGKTFLAMACAMEALAAQEVKRIVLVRPAVEAGESLGFLPGDPIQKVNPYLRPLFDALRQLSGDTRVEEHLKQDRIELAPLAYMRGRTLSDSFIILDEAQNTTVAQMKMFLTRIGRGSRCVVTGDETQIDLRQQESGLVDVLERVKRLRGCAVVRFKNDDSLRHPIVSRILRAYERPLGKR